MILVLLYDFILCIAHKAPPESCSRYCIYVKKKLHFFFTSADFLKTFSSNVFKEYHQSKNLDPYQA